MDAFKDLECGAMFVSAEVSPCYRTGSSRLEIVDSGASP